MYLWNKHLNVLETGFDFSVFIVFYFCPRILGDRDITTQGVTESEAILEKSIEKRGQ